MSNQMSEAHEADDRQQSWESSFPEEPTRIDVRAIDFILSLTPSERLRRLELEVQIEEARGLASTEALRMAAELLSKSAQENPFYGGEQP